jgi:transcriptional regulator with XRE-family HTH domain
MEYCQPLFESGYILSAIMVRHDTEEFFVELGANIARIRKELDMTQEALGAALGLRQQVIASYENGRRRIPLPVLLKVAEAMHMTIEDLVPAAKTSMPRKRGPVPKIERQWAKLRTLPDDKQKIISEMIDSWTR